MQEAIIKRTISLQWHITEVCDQRCKHCYIYRGKDKKQTLYLNLQTMELILDDFVKACERLTSIPFLAITGGDPLLYPNIWDFLEILNKKDIPFAIMGNPFHLNSDVVKHLEDLKCLSYQMSLDGLKGTHDFIRKPGSFDATLNALKYFENSKIRTTIMCTVSKLNINEIPQLVDIAVKNKVDNFAFSRYCPTKNEYDQMISPEEYRMFLDKMWNLYIKYKDSATRFALKDHLWKLYLYEKGIFKIDNFENSENLILDGCHCGIAHLSCLPDGTIYACRRSVTPVGKVPEQSFYDIFTSKALDQYRQFDKFEACSKCELKNFCRGCPSVAHGLTGNFYAKDPQCWKKLD